MLHTITLQLISSTCIGTCVNGTVRLIGGLVPTEGTVQMCVNGRWRELCNRYWGNQEAVVVCRQLGLPATGECYYSELCIISLSLFIVLAAVGESIIH